MKLSRAGHDGCLADSFNRETCSSGAFKHMMVCIKTLPFYGLINDLTWAATTLTKHFVDVQRVVIRNRKDEEVALDIIKAFHLNTKSLDKHYFLSLIVTCVYFCLESLCSWVIMEENLSENPKLKSDVFPGIHVLIQSVGNAAVSLGTVGFTSTVPYK